jgi:hypothetical protein
MLRDEGGRLADEDSSVYIGAAPAKDYDFPLILLKHTSAIDHAKCS